MDNAACFGELGADAHEVDVDVAGALAAFVYAPRNFISRDFLNRQMTGLGWKRNVELTKQ